MTAHNLLHFCNNVYYLLNGYPSIDFSQWKGLIKNDYFWVIVVGWESVIGVLAVLF